jgi:hypothetical protein
MYALGACLFTFFFGRIPFTAPTVAELFQRAQTAALAFPPSPPAPPALRALLEGLLDKDPGTRMTMRQVATHPWVCDNGRLPPLDVGAPPEGSPPAPAALAAREREGVSPATLLARLLAAAAEGAEMEEEEEEGQGGEEGEGGAAAESGAPPGAAAAAAGLDPGGAALAGLLSPELWVRTYEPGQYLVRQGERGEGAG